MIICKTPYRISFLGGGSDYPAYFEKNQGCVLTTTINKYCYISVRKLPPFFDNKYRIVWSKIESLNDIDAIAHPSVRECLRFMEIEDGLSITHDGDLPARTGMGSSSAFTVGLLNALYSYKGILADKKKLSKDAIYVEQQLIKEAVGCQDQIETAYGGLNRISFNKDDFTVNPVCINNDNKKKLEESMMLFFTGFSRTASEIAQEQINTMDKRMSDVERLVEMASEGERLLMQHEGIKDFGRLLNDAWNIKRNLTSKISTSYIDDIYNAAISKGAYGGKLLGAGGGGFILFIADKSKQENILRTFNNLVYVPIELESTGTHITHYDCVE